MSMDAPPAATQPRGDDEKRLAELGYYAPIAVGGLLVLVGLWWLLSARQWFTGPRRTIDD